MLSNTLCCDASAYYSFLICTHLRTRHLARGQLVLQVISGAAPSSTLEYKSTTARPLAVKVVPTMHSVISQRKPIPAAWPGAS